MPSAHVDVEGDGNGISEPFTVRGLPEPERVTLRPGFTRLIWNGRFSEDALMSAARELNLSPVFAHDQPG